MSRKFITGREIAFINRINRELLQKVVEEVVHYYSILVPETRVNDLYNEAVRKTWAPPVHCNALVLYDNANTTSTGMGQDSVYTVDVYFHTEELSDRNVSPKEGEFIEYGGVYYEVTSVTQPQLVFGQVNNKIMVKCSCVRAREGQFAAGAEVAEDVERGHGVVNSVCCPECGS